MLSAIGDSVGILSYSWSTDSVFALVAHGGEVRGVSLASNKDEAAYFLFRDPAFGTLSEAELEARVTRVLGDRAAPILAAHKAARPAESPWDRFVTIASEDRRLLSIEIAEKKAEVEAAGIILPEGMGDETFVQLFGMGSTKSRAGKEMEAIRAANLLTDNDAHGGDWIAFNKMMEGGAAGAEAGARGRRGGGRRRRG